MEANSVEFHAWETLEPAIKPEASGGTATAIFARRHIASALSELR